MITIIWIWVELRREEHYWKGVRLTEHLQRQAEHIDSEAVDTVEEQAP